MSNRTGSEWNPTTFSEIVVRLLNGGTPPTDVREYWNGTIPWITGADFTDFGIGEFRRFVSARAIQHTATNVVREGELLLVTRTGVGKLAIAPCDIAISQDITGVYADRNKVDVAFLYHLMRQGVEDLKRLNQGTSINGIVRGDLLAYGFDLPPLPEQRVVAEILSTLDRMIVHTEALVAKLEQVRTGLMHDLFTRGIMPNGELRPSREEAPLLYKESPLGWIPKEWETETVGRLFNVQLGKMLNQNAKARNYPAPYVGNRAVQWGAIDITQLEEMDFYPRERSKFRLEPGDLLVCEGGEVGRTAIWRGEIDECYYQKAIHRLRPHDGKILPLFMMHYMEFASSEGRFRFFTTQSSIAHLTEEKLRAVFVAVPPSSEQDLAIDRMDTLDCRVAATTEELIKLNKMRIGLMHDLLTGRVRVPESMLREAAPR